MYYKTCPHCGAHLDPGERCDCKREAASGATNTGDGKKNEAVTSSAILQEERGGCQAENDPRKRFPDLPMTEEEAQAFMEFEHGTGRPVRNSTVAHIVLLLLRAKDKTEMERILRSVGIEWGYIHEN